MLTVVIHYMVTCGYYMYMHWNLSTIENLGRAYSYM